MKQIALAAAAVFAMFCLPARGDIPAAEWEEFKAQFAAMAERVSALEDENRRLRAAAAAPRTVPEEDLGAEVAKLKSQNEASAWAERIAWDGDFRYRYEEIDEEDRDERNRNRVRARAALIAQASETTEVGFGLATGGDSPVSANQTLGGGGTRKDIGLDLAYIRWTGIENVFVTAGKFANTAYRVQGTGLIWDSDFRPEGLAAGWDDGLLFATVNYNFLESDSSNGEDAIYGVQVGARIPLAETMQLTPALKYLSIPSKGRPSYDPDDPDFFGNSSVLEDGELVYALDYDLINASLDFGFELAGWPVNLYADFVQNQDADDLDTGYLAGIALGRGKQRGEWQFRYQYQVLEADATLGLITDSNFAGGGTDGEGHRLEARYRIDDHWYVAATYFDNRRGVDLGDDADYQRLILDMSFSY